MVNGLQTHETKAPTDADIVAERDRRFQAAVKVNDVSRTAQSARRRSKPRDPSLDGLLTFPHCGEKP